MKLLTTTRDEKITAYNHLIEMNIGEYAPIARNVVKNNDLQRKRVKTANRSYSLLKEDIKAGCLIQPIILAFFPKEHEELQDIDETNILEKIKATATYLLILDGLQRTYTILDLLSEVKGDLELLAKINKLTLRVEVYTGISKVGVLYRMLTLNTGQTRMSTRHQVEMIYSDYKKGIDGLVFISEADNRMPTGEDEYNFSDVLDCFLSYITGDYFPINTEDLVSIIKNLEALTKDDKQKDIFKLLINSYNTLRIKINEVSNNWNYAVFWRTPLVDFKYSELKKKPFAFTVNGLFAKVQLLAGFGAALSFLIENHLIQNLEAVNEKIAQLNDNNINTLNALNLLIEHLDEIQVNAIKIGNEQRMYFYYFVRSLLNESNDGYLDIEKSVHQAYKFYKANTSR